MDPALLANVLEGSIINYTLNLVFRALSTTDTALLQDRKREALSALDFFSSLLDRDAEEIDFLQIYRERVLCYSPLALIAHKAHVSPHGHNDINTSQLGSARQEALSLPDILDTIFSQLPPFSRSSVNTLLSATLACRAFREPAQVRLWRYPLDLHSPTKQVQFAFAATLSRARDPLGRGLGVHVRRMRFHTDILVKNLPIMLKITAFTPNVHDFGVRVGMEYPVATRTIPGDELEEFSPQCRYRLDDVFKSLRQPKRLHFVKYSFTSRLPDHDERQWSEDRTPSSGQLGSVTHLTLRGIDWYFPFILNGSFSSLEELCIRGRTLVTSADAALAILHLPRLISLTLHTVGNLAPEHIESIVEARPKLEALNLQSFPRQDDAHSLMIIHHLSKLRLLKKLHVQMNPGLVDLSDLLQSRAPIEDLCITLTREAATSLPVLIKNKQGYLRRLTLLGSNSITPSEEIITTITDCPHLENLDVRFDYSYQFLKKVPIDVLEKFLAHPGLQLSEGLWVLFAHSRLSHVDAKFRERLKSAKEAEVSIEKDQRAWSEWLS